ncbi:WAP four-disulfide core domain protein 3-like [Kogia breviceps]|uniref:WAP four-disulfide core domain protein 3-like n=1 Tax=Kogia breviceps TaxID=27615 RepID=UPI0034D2B18F
MKTGTIFVLVAFIVWELEVACAQRPVSTARCLIECWNNWHCGMRRWCIQKGCSRFCSAFPKTGICLDQCQDNWDCEPGEQCIRKGCNQICSSDQDPDICVEECQSSWDCPSGRWCVYNGCGYICVPFEKLGKRFGTCPPVPEGSYGSCVDTCLGDETCPPGQKCCSNGCGHVCLEVQNERDIIVPFDEN